MGKALLREEDTLDSGLFGPVFLDMNNSPCAGFAERWTKENIYDRM